MRIQLQLQRSTSNQLDCRLHERHAEIVTAFDYANSQKVGGRAEKPIDSHHLERSAVHRHLEISQTKTAGHDEQQL